ncbi:hypothetical protein AB4Z22_00130 [Paenibacillus sp. TAF58]
MILDDEMKKRIKDERLLEYSRRIYVLELDIAALEATGEKELEEKHRIALDNFRKAYAAVEVM